MKITLFAHLKEYLGNLRNILRDVCMDFEAYFKVHSLVSVHPKSIILDQMTNLNMIFHVVSVNRFVKIWNSLQFPAEFRNGQLSFTLCIQTSWELHHTQLMVIHNIERLFPQFFQCVQTIRRKKNFICFSLLLSGETSIADGPNNVWIGGLNNTNFSRVSTIGSLSKPRRRRRQRERHQIKGLVS